MRKKFIQIQGEEATHIKKIISKIVLKYARDECVEKQIFPQKHRKCER